MLLARRYALSVSYSFLFFAQLTHVWRRHTAILERLAS